MKSLVFQNVRGDKSSYSLILPEGMSFWNVSDFHDYLKAGTEHAITQGYLIEPTDPFRHEQLRSLVLNPQYSYNCPIQFQQNKETIATDGRFDCSEDANFVFLDRQPSSDPDHTAINVANRNADTLASNSNAITALIDELFDFRMFPIVTVDGQSVQSFGQLLDDFAQTLDPINQIRFFFRIAQIIHLAPFENFSKILMDIPFRSGLEMWHNITIGFGGICAEKTAALKYICDIVGIPHTHVLGARTPIPDDFEAILVEYLQARGEIPLKHEISHHFLELQIADERILVDTTNGNVPMLFLTETDSEPYFNTRFTARMVYQQDHLHITRVPQWVGDTMLTLSEYHIPELHYQYVFDQELGLHISDTAYIGVYHDWGAKQSARIQHHYAALAQRIHLPYPFFIQANSLDSVPDRNLAQLLRQTLETLRVHYLQTPYTGDFTFILQPLKGHFWQKPRVSSSIQQILESWNIDFSSSPSDTDLCQQNESTMSISTA